MMAIIICDKHGRQGCPFVSPDVLKAMEENNPANIVCITFLIKEGDELVDYGYDLYMKKEELGISPFTGLLYEKEEIMVFDDDDQMDMISCMFKPVCGACFCKFMGWEDDRRLGRTHIHLKSVATANGWKFGGEASVARIG
jgi:hypothetical protein